MKFLKIFLITCFLTALAVPAYAGSTTVSGTTAQTFIDRARNDLKESASSATTLFWTDGMLIQWIDEAVKEIVYKTRCLESAVSNQLLTENVRSYSIATASGASQYLDIEKVEYDMGISGDTVHKSQIYDLDRVPFSSLRYGHEKEKGDPKTYSLWNDTLYVWPIPRSDQSGNTLYIYRTLLPDGVKSSTSAIETPAYFDPAILLYVEARAKYREHQNHAQFQNDLATFNARIQQYRIDIMRREVITTPTP
jgi:hypothetical protein